jgi:hypothetical protein
VSYAWYDASRTQLLREAGCIQDGTVVATLRADELPAGLPAQLAARGLPPVRLHDLRHRAASLGRRS